MMKISISSLSKSFQGSVASISFCALLLITLLATSLSVSAAEMINDVELSLGRWANISTENVAQTFFDDNIDNDNDGLPEAWEMQYRFSDVNPADAEFDFDGDGLTNLQEFLAATSPVEADTDGDGIVDGDDFAPTNSRYKNDTDNDGLPEVWELLYGFSDAAPETAALDFDGDGLSNLQEFLAMTNPLAADTDSDGVVDGEDFSPTNALYKYDVDSDGLPEAWEVKFGLYDKEPLDAVFDFDGDGLTNLQEFLAGTNPLLKDTDGDGIFDGDDLAPTTPNYDVYKNNNASPSPWKSKMWAL